MIKRFLHISLVVLLLLAATFARGVAQSRFNIFPDSVFAGQIALGTTYIDSFTIESAQDTFRLMITMDQGVEVLTPSQYPLTVEPNGFYKTLYRVTPFAQGLRTVRIILRDSIDGSVRDSLTITYIGFQPSVFDVSRDTIDLGKVLVGGEVRDSLDIISITSPFTPKINFFQDDTLSEGSITFVDSLPDSLFQGQTHRIHFLTRSALLGQQALRFLVTDSLKEIRSITVLIEGIDTTLADSAFGLRHGVENVLAFRTTDDKRTVRVRVRNTSNGEIVIKSFNIEDSPFFDIEDVPVVPLILDVGSEFEFDIFFDASEEGFYQSNIRLPDDGGLASEFTIGVQALKMAQSSVPPIVTASGIRVTQSFEHLAIENIPFESGSIEIYDVLGRRLNTYELSGSQILIPKRDTKGAPLTDGGYIIRISAAKDRRSETLKLLLVNY